MSHLCSSSRLICSLVRSVSIVNVRPCLDFFHGNSGSHRSVKEVGVFGVRQVVKASYFAKDSSVNHERAAQRAAVDVDSLARVILVHHERIANNFGSAV